jgi:alpha-L-arabinofuranosidase
MTDMTFLVGLGPFEFAEFARVADIEMVMTTKASGYDGSEFAELLDYCYGNATTEWGAQRIADGYTDPFTFTYFELGMQFMYSRLRMLVSCLARQRGVQP